MSDGGSDGGNNVDPPDAGEPDAGDPDASAPDGGDGGVADGGRAQADSGSAGPRYPYAECLYCECSIGGDLRL